MKRPWLAINARYTFKAPAALLSINRINKKRKPRLPFFVGRGPAYFLSQPFLWKYQKGTVIDTAISASEKG